MCNNNNTNNNYYNYEHLLLLFHFDFNEISAILVLRPWSRRPEQFYVEIWTLFFMKLLIRQSVVRRQGVARVDFLCSPRWLTAVSRRGREGDRDAPPPPPHSVAILAQEQFRFEILLTAVRPRKGSLLCLPLTGMALGIDGNVSRSLLFLLPLGCLFGMSVFPSGTSLSLSFLMIVSGSQDFPQVPTPTLCMSFDGRAAVENSSQGLVFEPAAPSLLVFSFEGHEVEASVRILAKAASGLCEADPMDLVSEASGAFQGYAVSETRGGAVTACSVSHAALGRLAPFVSCPVGGLTWPGSCPGFQFLFVAAMLGAIVFAAFLGFFFLNLVPFLGSWTVEEVVSFQEAKAKGKRRSSGEHSVGWLISYLFTPRCARVVSLAGLGGRHSSCISVCACRCLHIRYAHWYSHTGRRLRIG